MDAVSLGVDVVGDGRCVVKLLERIAKSTSGNGRICEFANSSVRQTGFWICDKLVYGVGDVVGQHRVPASVLCQAHD